MDTKNTELIARLLLSTKRKKRDFSIVEIAKDIEQLKYNLGNLNEVAKVIGISSGMLNQFLSVFKLPVSIQNLVHKRKIDKVAVVHLLSKFPIPDIEQLTPQIIEGKITSQELKVLLPYRKKHQEENILDLLQKLNASKNIKISVIRFPMHVARRKLAQITEVVKTIVSEDNFISLTEDGNQVEIRIKKKGERLLRDRAKEKKITLSDLIATLIR